MLLAWMFGTMLFTTLIGVAAAGFEAAQRMQPVQVRRIWMIALAVSVGWPIAAPLIARQQVLLLQPIVISSQPTGAVRAVLDRIPALQTASSARIDAVVATLWIALTVLLLLRLIRAAMALSRIAQDAEPATVDGCAVLLTPHFGPATIGLRTPRIALPQWINEFEPSLRSLIVRHEHQHQLARDTTWIWIAEFATALMPWNPAIWWQARRLRLAIEVDCDLRTVHAEDAATVSAYAKLLVFVAQRQQHEPRAALVAAFHSHLHTRIIAMHRPLNGRTSLLPKAMFAMAILALGTACSQRVRSGLSPMASPGPAPTTADRVYADGQVEHPVTVRTPESKAPVFPAELRDAKQEGSALVEFVVDTNGNAIVESFKVLKATDARFAAAVLGALPDFRYTPATIAGGRKVKQRVVQPFMFALSR